MTVILSPMRIFSSSFKVKINMVVLMRRGRPSSGLTCYLLLGFSFLSPFCLSFLGFWASLLSLSFLPLSPTALSFDSSTFQSWLRGKILKRLLNWSSYDEFPLLQTPSPSPSDSFSQRIPYTRAGIFSGPSHTADNTLSPLIHASFASGSSRFSVSSRIQDRPHIGP